MIGTGTPWAFIGLFTGLGKLALIALVTLVAYGRSPVLRGLVLRALRPTSTAPRATPQAASRLGDRWFVALVVTAATGVAAWIVTRMTMTGPAGPTP